MKELSLFSGAGGGLLATKHLLGWETVGYVEIDEYCQAVLAQRIKDGYLDSAPIFGDITQFISEGYAEAYQGMVDVITAGFPCQPFSTAGRRQADDDERNMWPQTMETICIVGPQFALLENVPGLLVYEYFGEIFGDLVESGYCIQWKCISAAELGAPHKRDRLWLVAYRNGQRSRQVGTFAKNDGKRKAANDPGQVGLLGRTEKTTDTNGKMLEKRDRMPGRQSQRPRKADWWSTEPRLGRVADGVANRVDRLKAIGNGQVSIVAATAWKILAGEWK